jgi:hypothetical protein
VTYEQRQKLEALRPILASCPRPDYFVIYRLLQAPDHHTLTPHQAEVLDQRAPGGRNQVVAKPPKS